MQTFIPKHSFKASAEVLDNKRLNKQALEGWQILMVLLELDPAGNHRPAKGWRNHPAVNMWRGHENALYRYIQCMVTEWKARGFNSTIGDKAQQTMLQASAAGIIDIHVHSFPQWMEDIELYARIASSHRTALLNKEYEWYSQFGWVEDSGIRPAEYAYIWPSPDGTYVVGDSQTTKLRQVAV